MSRAQVLAIAVAAAIAFILLGVIVPARQYAHESAMIRDGSVSVVTDDQSLIGTDAQKRYALIPMHGAQEAWSRHDTGDAFMLYSMGIGQGLMNLVTGQL